jgi:hypothetical protein
MNLSLYPSTQQFLRKVYDNILYLGVAVHREVIK